MPKNNQWTTVTSKKSQKSKKSTDVKPSLPSTKPKENATVVEYNWDSHQSLNSFKCPMWYCDKGFSKNDDLKRHIKKIHTDKSDTMSSYNSQVSSIQSSVDE